MPEKEYSINDVLRSTIENEKEIIELYKQYSKTFEQDKEFWQGLINKGNQYLDNIQIQDNQPLEPDVSQEYLETRINMIESMRRKAIADSYWKKEFENPRQRSLRIAHKAETLMSGIYIHKKDPNEENLLHFKVFKGLYEMHNNNLETIKEYIKQKEIFVTGLYFMQKSDELKEKDEKLHDALWKKVAYWAIMLCEVARTDFLLETIVKQVEHQAKQTNTTPKDFINYLFESEDEENFMLKLQMPY